MAIDRVLLVHGAWLGAWCWSELQHELELRSIPSDAIDLPGHGASPLPPADLTADADAVVRALERVGENTLLVGHSYGGAVITQAAARTTSVSHLLYIAAFALDHGESVNGFLRSAPRHHVELADAMVLNDERTATTLNESVAGELLYPTLNDDRRRVNVARHCAQPTATMTQPVDGWPRMSIPSTYVLCRKDRLVHPTHQEILATRCDTTVVLDTDHSPFIEDVHTVANIIEEIVTSK